MDVKKKSPSFIKYLCFTCFSSYISEMGIDHFPRLMVRSEKVGKLAVNSYIAYLE